MHSLPLSVAFTGNVGRYQDRMYLFIVPRFAGGVSASVDYCLCDEGCLSADDHEIVVKAAKQMVVTGMMLEPETVTSA